MDVFGHTRSRYARDYALITAETHVNSLPIGWEKTSTVIHIAPEMGARFTQYTAAMEAGGTSCSPGDGVQRFIYVQSGSCKLQLEESHELSAGGFAFIPSDTSHQISCSEPTTLIVFEKTYTPHPDFDFPKPVVGNASDVQGESFMGDEGAQLQTLLPIAPEFDMAVNIFTYQPGATLPQVEIHVMEHGLQMLSGKGVYRLSDDYFPVTEGDIIWMASFCPQWFVAMGKTPASYIYYKDIHRDRLSEKE